MRTYLNTAGIVALSLTIGVGASACSRNSAEGDVAADCEPANSFSTIQDGTLTVGQTEIPPFSYTEDGSPAGVDVDIVTEFAADNCLTVTYEPVTYAAAVPSISNNRIDLTIGDWYRTAARAEVVNLSAPTYTDQFSVISKEGADTVSALEGKKVGTVDGYLWVDDLRTLLGDDLQVYPSSAELKKDIEAGRVEIGIDAYGTAIYGFGNSDWQVATVAPDPRVAATVEPPQVGFPYSKENTELGTALDASIDDMHASGRIEEILVSHGLPDSAAEVGDPRLVN